MEKLTFLIIKSLQLSLIYEVNNAKKNPTKIQFLVSHHTTTTKANSNYKRGGKNKYSVNPKMKRQVFCQTQKVVNWLKSGPNLAQLESSAKLPHAADNL